MICDARHDSTANAYHTTVPCILGATHKVAGIQTLSRETHRVAQTREVDATMMVLESVKERGECKLCIPMHWCTCTIIYTHVPGLVVAEVAHDMNLPLTKRLVEAGYVNSFDTWHGELYIIVLFMHGHAMFHVNPHTISVGTKGVSNAMKNITAGPKKDMEKKWFSQLSDKSKLQTRIHQNKKN